jgi:MFS family permease
VNIATHPGYPIVRAIAALALISIGGGVMYFAIVGLKPISSEFGVSRAIGSIPYTVTMVGFGLGGILMGYISDRIGVMPVVLFGGFMLTMGFGLAGQADSIIAYSSYHFLFLSLLGCATMMAPLVADISHWFSKRRGIAVGVVISGSYVAGSIWPPVAQHYFDTLGWRESYLWMSWFCLVTTVPLALVLAPNAKHLPGLAAEDFDGDAKRPLAMPAAALQCLLCVAGIGCCAAMAVPQVHIVAHATDLGFAGARGAEMLALMFMGGVVSRLGSGWLSDRIGGLRTLALGSALQAMAVASFLFVDTMLALYIASALFGLSQGGIVPSYTIIIRRFFAPDQAGWRIGLTLFFTMLGMAIGGWFAGALFDMSGNYNAAFIMGVAFNVAHLAIAGWLLLRARNQNVTNA